MLKKDFKIEIKKKKNQAKERKKKMIGEKEALVDLISF